MKRIIIIFILLVFESVNAQNFPIKEIGESDSIKLKMIDNSTLFMNKNIENKDYLVYSIGKSIIFIVEQENKYSIFYLKEIFDFKDQKIFIKQDSLIIIEKNIILKNIFDFNCNESILSYSADKYHAVSYIYFKLMKNNCKCIEFHLPFITFTSENINYPISDDLHAFLFKKLYGF